MLGRRMARGTRLAAPKAPGSARARASHLARHDEPLPRSTTEQLVAQQATLAHIGQLALSNRSLGDVFKDACALVGQVLDTELVALLELSADQVLAARGPFLCVQVRGLGPTLSR